MATRFLNSGNPIVIIAVILLCMAIRAGAFVLDFPFYEAGKSTLFYNLLFAIPEKNPVLNFILGMFLAVIQGFIFNRLVQEQKLITRISNLPFALFMFLSSLFPHITALSPQLAAATFSLLAIKVLLSNSKSLFSIKKYFQTGLFMGVAALFEPAAIILLLFPFINALYFHTQYFRALLIPFIGFFLSYYLAYGFASVFAGEFLFEPDYFFLKATFKGFSGSFYYAAVLFPLLLFGFGFPVLGKLTTETVQVRKVYLLLFWWAAACVPYLILSAHPGTAGFSVVIPSIAAVITYQLFFSKRNRVSDFVIYGILVLTIINNWFLP